MDSPSGNRDQIARQANYWLTKRDAGLMEPEDEAALHAWLAVPDHAQAYSRAQTIFNAIAVVPMGDGPHSAPPERRRRQRRLRMQKPRRAAWVGGAMAASLAALIMVGADLPMRMRADAIAPVGRTRHVALPDGSGALLDSGAAIAISYGNERRVRLLRGQAAFTVAPDALHPFVVDANGGTTTALGTRFIVSRIAPQTRVTVTEHSVRVVADGTSQIVPDGSSLTYDARGMSRPTPVRVTDVDAWTRGRIRFVNRPLREVVAELGRYHRGYIGMVDGDIGNLPVNGVFSTADPIGAIDIIQNSLGIASYRLGDSLIWLHD